MARLISCAVAAREDVVAGREPLQLLLAHPLAEVSERLARVLALLGGLLGAPRAVAWSADEVDFPGDQQGWSLGLNSTKYTGPDGSPEAQRAGHPAGAL